jgi:hypothetical protein
MRVQINSPFEVDTATGRVAYAAGQIVPNGQKNWVDKGLAKEVDEPNPPKDTASKE